MDNPAHALVKQNAVIGINGGGTRSQGVVLSGDGILLARHHGMALNFYTTSWAVFRDHLKELMHVLWKAVPQGYEVTQSVLGVAALFGEASLEETRQVCRGILPEESVYITGDGPIALFGATRGKPGLLVVSGTGSIAVALLPDGTFRTEGGYGPLIDGDPGSAFWMATEAVQLAAGREGMQESDLCPLGQAITRHFGVKTLREIVPMVYSGPVGARRLAELSAVLAREESARATGFGEIELRAGKALAHLALPLVDGLVAHLPADQEIPVFISGSVLDQNRHVRNAFERELQNLAGARCRVAEPQLDPAVGAALLALHREGKRVDELQIRSHISSSQ